GGKDIVFLLDPKLSARALAEFRKRDVWAAPLDAFQVESVRFGYAKNPFVLTKTETGEWRGGEPGGRPRSAGRGGPLGARARRAAGGRRRWAAARGGARSWTRGRTSSCSDWPRRS